MSKLAKNSVDFGTEVSDERKEKITKITIHHMADVSDPVNCAKYHLRTKKASANYYIGTDGTIVSGVSENRRPWGSSNSDNDQKAITIEVSNSRKGEKEKEWPVSDKAYNALIDLCADICNRYKITLNWTGTKDGTLTCHYMFKATECPGPYLKARMSNIANAVNKEVKKIKNY